MRESVTITRYESFRDQAKDVTSEIRSLAERCNCIAKFGHCLH